MNTGFGLPRSEFMTLHMALALEVTLTPEISPHNWFQCLACELGTVFTLDLSGVTFI